MTLLELTGSNLIYIYLNCPNLIKPDLT